MDRPEHRLAIDEEMCLTHLYETYSPMVYSYCRRVFGSDASADATQEVFASAWRARHRYDPSRASVKTWIMAIARNHVIDEVRARARRGPTPSVTYIEVGEDANPTDAVTDRVLLTEALERLPERNRQAIALSFVAGFTHGEIAERTDYPLGTVKSDIRRGLEQLRVLLRSEEKTLTLEAPRHRAA